MCVTPVCRVEIHLQGKNRTFDFVLCAVFDDEFDFVGRDELLQRLSSTGFGKQRFDVRNQANYQCSAKKFCLEANDKQIA